MPSILTVDDEPSLHASLVMAFETQGYRSAGAASAAKALDMLRGTPFDVILTDLGMPGMDGLSLMDRVHAVPDMVIILMTGGATVDRGSNRNPRSTPISPTINSRWSISTT